MNKTITTNRDNSQANSDLEPAGDDSLSAPDPQAPVVVPVKSTSEDAAFARRVLTAEADAIRQIVVTAGFDRAVKLVTDRVGKGSKKQQSETNGTLVVSGLGKSGLIGQKLSATFASTGTPSHFLHPTEAMHGDLGRVRRDDVVLILSFGGCTEEVVTLAAILKQDGVPSGLDRRQARM